MISQRDGGDGMKTTKAHLTKRLIEWQSKVLKMEMGSFLHKLEPLGTMLGFSFMFTQA